MATNSKKTTNDNDTTFRPTHSVYQVLEQKDGNKFWKAIGAAWPHKDGKGFNIRLDSVPVPFDGQLTIRERNYEKDGGQ